LGSVGAMLLLPLLACGPDAPVKDGVPAFWGDTDLPADSGDPATPDDSGDTHAPDDSGDTHASDDSGDTHAPDDTGEPPPDPARAALRERLASFGVTALEPPPDVPDALLELGILLNADPILSGNRNISCATCHQPALGGDDDRATGIGQGGIGVGTERDGEFPVAYVGRNTQVLFNAHLLTTMFWDGHAVEHEDGSFTSSFEDAVTPDLASRLTYGAAALQVLNPLTIPDEMLGFSGDNEVAGYLDTHDWTAIWAGLTARVVATEGYRPYFEAAYPDVPFEEITIGEIANAIGAMEIAAYASAGSPFDRFLVGDDDALSDDAVEGAMLFYDVAGPNCVACHSGPLLTDLSFHGTALAQFGKGKACTGAEIPGLIVFDDLGHECASNSDADRYRFRTAPLRNLGASAPYGHAGQYRSVEDFVRHYMDPLAALEAYDPAVEVDDPNVWGTTLATRDVIWAQADPLLADVHLTEEQIAPILAFLEALDDPGVDELDAYLPSEVPSGLPVDRP
jgi:cytochrome c peroxidase